MREDYNNGLPIAKTSPLGRGSGLMKNTKVTTQTSNSFCDNAPELLLGKIAELNGTLSKYRNGNQNSDSLKFYEDILRIMRLAFSYMQHTKWIYNRNAILESNVKFLAQYSQQLQQKLDEIETVSRLRQEDRLDEVLDLSDDYVEKVLSIKRSAASDH